MPHIVLLGDSIFDNAGYVQENEAVIDQLNEKVPADISTTLLAVDGDVTMDVFDQLSKLPIDATHLFISCGGNDALRIASVLAKPVASVAEAMELFADIRREFQKKYSLMLNACQSRGKHLVVCTVHDSVPDYEERALTALAFFNEIILKEAIARNLPVIDLRLTCNSTEDYSYVSPIEPSKEGGRKISDLIIKVLNAHDFSSNVSHVYF